MSSKERDVFFPINKTFAEAKCEIRSRDKIKIEARVMFFFFLKLSSKPRNDYSTDKVGKRNDDSQEKKLKKYF